MTPSLLPSKFGELSPCLHDVKVLKQSCMILVL